MDARGRDAAPYFAEIRSGIGALLINSRAAPAEIAVLYSPASMRTQWMLDWQAKGDSWARNGTESAGDDNATDIFGRLVTHLGLQGQIISSAMVAQGALQRGGWRVLILPNAIALSSQEADEIRRFVARGGTVIADAEPATYDQHSRRLAKPLLADIFKPAQAQARRYLRKAKYRDLCRFSARFAARAAWRPDSMAVVSDRFGRSTHRRRRHAFFSEWRGDDRSPSARPAAIAGERGSGGGTNANGFRFSVAKDLCHLDVCGRKKPLGGAAIA